LSIVVEREIGIGGRNFYVASEAISIISDTDTFVSFATDGIDNKSIGAGAVVDIETKRKLEEKNLNSKEYHDEDKDSELFIEIGDAIITGDTGRNVSDLYILLQA
jgi:glycerate-2-kinase